VFQCVNATCGYFHHPKCIQDCFIWENKVAAGDLEKKIASGESFSCPVHKCSVCALAKIRKYGNYSVLFVDGVQNHTTGNAYQGKSLLKVLRMVKPRPGHGKELLPNRILIYCLDHEIDEEIETPARDHIKFLVLKRVGFPFRKGNFLSVIQDEGRR
ncbi:hypothetical protein Csa_013015, partial [Cucumis sativus]